MIKWLICLLLWIATNVSAADLDIRHYWITNNVSSPLSKAVNQYFYTGESVNFDLWAKRGKNAIDLTGTNMIVLWEFNVRNQPTSLVVTGAVVTATNGYVRFATPIVTLTNQTLESRVKLYQEIAGTNKYIGVLYAANAYILPTSATVNTNYVGPFPNNL